MRHGDLTIPRCDVLVHAGDFTNRGKWEDFERFAQWLSAQRATHKVFVAGNHDFVCEREVARVRTLASELGLTYLCDEAAVVGGLRFYGSPATPRFHDMAFNYERGAALERHWARIPDVLDVLVTHGPPRGLGDRTFLGVPAGCEALLDRVRVVRPMLHVYGHIHEGYGEHRVPGLATRFVNAATKGILPFALRAPVSISL